MSRPEISKAQHYNQLVKKAAKGGGIIFAGRVLDRLVRLSLQIVLARVLGAGIYGLYSLGYVLTMIGSQISMLGLQNGIVRFVALYRGVGDLNRVKGTLISALAISTSVSIMAGTFLWLFSGTISRFFDMAQLDIVLKIFAFAFPFYAITIAAEHTARAFHAMKYAVLVKSISHPMANAVVVVVSFLLGFRLLGAVFGFFASSVLSAFLGLYLVKRVFPKSFSDIQPIYQIKEILWFSIPVLLVGFSYFILYQTDRIMLGYFRDSKDLGVYTAAGNFSSQCSLVYVTIGYTVAPIFADLHNRGKTGEMERLFKTASRWATSLTLPIILTFVLFSKNLMGIFGPEYASGWLVLVVLSCSQIIVISAGCSSVLLQMSGNQNIELINTSVVAILNVVLNIWLINIYGVLGAAMATGLSILTGDVARVIEIYRLLGIHPYGIHHYKSLLAGTVAMLVSGFLAVLDLSNLFWIVNIVILFVLYFSTLYLLGLNDEDRVLLKTVRSRFALSLSPRKSRNRTAGEAGIPMNNDQILHH